MSGAVVSLRALIERLEALADALPESPSIEALAQYATDRGPVAEQIAGIDPVDLSDGEKSSLSARLARVLERDQALVLALFARREDVAGQLRVVQEARTAMRGYSGPSETAQVFRKTA